jgi:hypothetical protein
VHKLAGLNKEKRRSEHIAKISGSEKDYIVLAVRNTLETHLELLGTNEKTLKL